MIVDVSGYSYSGKGAVMDILRDFPTLHVHQKEFEFLLIRSTDGLLDLRSALIGSPSEIRSDMAIRRFLALVQTLSSKRSSLSRPLSFFRPPGQNYSEIFPDFEEYSLSFVLSVSSISKEYWPFPSLYKSHLGSFMEKVGNVFSEPGMRMKFNSYLTCNNFDTLMNEYVRKVLFSEIPKQKDTVVTSNMLEVYSPVDFFKAVQPCKLIVVDRDPRGIFCSMPSQKSGLDNSSLAQDFVKRFRFQRSNKFIQNLEHDNVLRVKFEEIFIDFSGFINKLSLFLEVPVPIEFNNFSRKTSIQNVRPWGPYKDTPGIKFLEKELPDFLLTDDQEVY